MRESLDTRRPWLVLTLFCLLLWLPGFFTLPPGDRDESRFVQATKQMLETGDAVTIRNGEEARNRKPIGIHWLQLPFAAAARAAGLAEANPVWPYRVPSLLGGWVAVLGTYEIGRRLLDRRAALLGAGVLAASVVLVVETHIAKTDAALLGVVVLAMGVLARAWRGDGAGGAGTGGVGADASGRGIGRDSGGLGAGGAALFWLASAAGVLIKGPILLLVVGLAVLALVLWERRAAWLLALRPGWGVPLMLAAVLPWFVAIGVATEGRFFADSVGGDLGRKLASGEESHWGPPGLHLLLLPLLLFPATAVLPGAVWAAWRERRDPAVRFLIAWAVPAWLVFEAAPTKLPHYTLPLLPAVCLLVARFALGAVAAPRWARGLGAGLLVLAAAVLGAGAVALPVVLGAPVWLGLPGLAAAASVGWLALRSREGRGVLAGLAAVPLVYWAILGLELPRLEPLWIAPRVVESLRRHPPPPARLDVTLPPGVSHAAPLGAVGFHEPSLMFLAGTDTRWIATGEEGARALAAGGVRLLLVEGRNSAAFRDEAASLGLHPRELDRIEGFNISRGRRVVLTLFGL